MTIKALELGAPKKDEQIELSPGVTVLTGPGTRDVSFPNLASAIKRLVELLRDSADKKLAAARVVQAVDKQQLYREAGFETMRDFYPTLLAQTAAVGWQAERTVKMWLAFANLYLDQLALPEPQAMRSNSHLHALYVLADVDRKSGELLDATEKEGKLGAVEFEDITRVISALVTAPTPAQKAEGLDADATAEVLKVAGVSDAALTTFEKRAGTKPAVPVSGWSVADTRSVIEAIRGVKETTKAVQVFYVSFSDAAHVEIDRVAWELDGSEKYSQSWKRSVETPDFEAMSKGHKVVDISEGEPEGDDLDEDE